ncbi:HU family DNA-binding protein [uncultured Bacteroides sp.]|uniref:HU family DNA-binding protein n=1 Tax=uncultured Bacteroides sp. TaxID=162156 RepID=UPI002AA86934|nr:HU family DNA-binding protein [uncultured Bacteroides sp.]
MPLFYKATQSSLATKDGSKKWHPRLVKVGKVINTQKIGEMIAEKSSLTAGDVHSVIRNLMTVMREQLMNSRTVKLEGLGTFTVIANTQGKGVDKQEDVASNQIARLRVNFSPEYTRSPGTGGITRALYAGVEYERWAGTAAAETPEEGDGNDGNGGGNEEDPNA